MNKKERFEAINKIYGSKSFKNNIFILGAGCMGSINIYFLKKIFNINNNQITIFDKDIKTKDKIIKNYGDIKFVHIEIKKDNLDKVLKNIKKNDILIDCSYNIDITSLYMLCNKKGCSYINSSIEDWGQVHCDNLMNTMKFKTEYIKEYAKDQKNISTNFIICMGMNPGVVNMWVKLALDMINKKYKYKYSSYAELAQKLNINTIHISEKDTQKTNQPKQDNEYVNTWSSNGVSMYEEATATAEGSWGTHEKHVPENVEINPLKYGNYLVLKNRGISTHLISYTPLSKQYIGMMVRHDESYTIGKSLTVYKDNNIIYKPSVYYVYHPCDGTISSFYELRERNNIIQDKTRLLTNDITNGRDELGITIFMGNGDVYWLGSLLDIIEAREITGNEHNDIVNATNIQVALGYMMGVIQLIDLMNKNEYKGIIFPDELDHNKLLQYSIPFMGPFKFEKVNCAFFNSKFNRMAKDNIDITNKWQFEDFIVEFD